MCGATVAGGWGSGGLVGLFVSGRGESCTDPDLSIEVTGALVGGFSVHVSNPALTIVPDVEGDTPQIASQRASSARLVPSFTGVNQERSLVVSQSPLAGDTVSRGSTVTMKLSTGPFQKGLC